MKEFSYVITDKEGIHARPAGLLVKEAQKFKSQITVGLRDKKGDAKRIFTIMGLGAKKDDEITVTCDGEDEAEACEAIKNFLENNM